MTGSRADAERAADAAPGTDAPNGTGAPGVGSGDGDAAAAEEVEAGRGLLALRLGDADYGVWLDEVLEITPTPPISRLPLAHAEVAGVTSVRGDIVPVIDLGVRLLEAPARRPGRLVLVRHDETNTVLGLLVDDVATLVEVHDEDVEETPKAAEATLPPGMAAGVVPANDRVITILNLGPATAPPGSDSKES